MNPHEGPLKHMGIVVAMAVEGLHPDGVTPETLVRAIRDEVVKVYGCSVEEGERCARAVEEAGYQAFIAGREAAQVEEELNPCTP